MVIVEQGVAKCLIVVEYLEFAIHLVGSFAVATWVGWVLSIVWMINLCLMFALWKTRRTILF